MRLNKQIVIWLTVFCIFITIIIQTPVGAWAGTDLKEVCNEVDTYPIISLENPPVKDYDVLGLQIRLGELGYYKGPDDGVYDPETCDSIREFKKDHGLLDDAVLGEKTWKVLAETYEQEVAQKTENPTGQVSIQVDVQSRKLTVFSDGTPFRVFPVAVGKQSTPSPIGEWRITSKAVHWGTGFGTRWMGLNVPWGIYGIHGTNKPWSIGTKASHGCIRMRNQDVEILYKWVTYGTEVQIVGSLPRKDSLPKLKKGQANQDVVSLQFLLRQTGLFTGPADGRFGEVTEQAVLRFQAIEGLPENGIVDAGVWRALWNFINLKDNPNETDSV